MTTQRTSGEGPAPASPTPETHRPESEALAAAEFYKANATNIVDVPRPGHPEDPSGWAGVRRASEARFIADNALVMTLPDAFQFAEAYANYKAVALEAEEKLKEFGQIYENGKYVFNGKDGQ